MSRKKRKKGQGGALPGPTQTQPTAAGAQKSPVMVIVASVAVLALLLGAAWWWMGRETQPVTPESSPDNPVVVIETNRGTIEVELYPEHAPITVKNFLQYVDDKHYDGTIFHRVISNFMIQGGGMTPEGKEKNSRAPIKNESYNGLQNKRGTIAMARTKVAHSATDQFYINVVDNDSLDRANASDGVGYAVFGNVIKGMDVVDEIRNVETVADRPTSDIIIESVRRAKKQ